MTQTLPYQQMGTVARGQAHALFAQTMGHVAVTAGLFAASAHAAYGLPFGAAVWTAGYVVLPEGGLYKPIWQYDAETLAWDLSGHLAYGAGTGITCWLFARALD